MLVAEEMTAIRESAASDNCGGTSLADILQSALPSDTLSHLTPLQAGALQQQQPIAIENAKNAAPLVRS